MRTVWLRVVPLVLFTGTIAAPAYAAPHKSGPKPAVFEVGASVRDISPNPTVAPPDGSVWLGGFGFGRADRRSTGVNMPISARAMVISNGADTVAFAINETQGMFASYSSGPYGLDDMRSEIHAETGIPLDHIVLGS